MPSEIKEIQKLVKAYHHTSRCEISRQVCKTLGWKSENGNLKAWVCREFLLILEKKNYLKLPPPKPYSENRLLKKEYKEKFKRPNQDLVGKLNSFSHPELHRVKNRKMNNLWEQLVSENHYLGYNGIVGRYLKYIVFIEDFPVACLGWGGAAWKLESRESWMGWDRKDRKSYVNSIVNNFRFLILPWVKIKYLSSHLLSRSVPAVSRDWEEQYGTRVKLLETFVDSHRFNGTCYKAANWTLVGQTKGFSKQKTGYSYHAIKKDIYLYPIQRKKHRHVANFKSTRCNS